MKTNDSRHLPRFAVFDKTSWILCFGNDNHISFVVETLKTFNYAFDSQVNPLL